MHPNDDPFIALAGETLADEFGAPHQRAVVALPAAAAPQGVAIGRLHGFDLLEQPLVTQLAACPGQVLAARSTVILRHAMVGREVVVMFNQGDPGHPIVMGVIEPNPLHDPVAPAPEAHAQVDVDGERHIVQAEREIVLRCGDASITLTRAGKVIIKGNYITTVRLKVAQNQLLGVV